VNQGAHRRQRGFGAAWIAPLLVLASLTACRSKPTIQNGSEVKLHYTLTVDGETVDTSRKGEPLSFVVGSGQIIPGLEEQLKGMSKNDRKTIIVPPEKGYGPVRPNAIQKVPRKNFQDAGALKPGMRVTAPGPQGQLIQARVVEIGKDQVTLDLNHPLAGKTLNFDVEIVDVTGGKKA
jgi:FKBP-type peptidyl-prolyl cis-trans isomerase 2